MVRDKYTKPYPKAWEKIPAGIRKNPYIFSLCSCSWSFKTVKYFLYTLEELFIAMNSKLTTSCVLRHTMLELKIFCINKWNTWFLRRCHFKHSHLANTFINFIRPEHNNADWRQIFCSQALYYGETRLFKIAVLSGSS